MHVVRGAHEHAARSAGGVEHRPAFGLDDVHDHADKGLGSEEHPVVARDRRRELSEEVLVDASDDVVAFFVQLWVVEDAEDVAQ